MYQVEYDFYNFLTSFMYKYPQFKKRPLYIAGESYAGHYIPAFAKIIKHYNNPDMNLKGLMIGNGWVDPFYQYPAYNTFANE